MNNDNCPVHIAVRGRGPNSNLESRPIAPDRESNGGSIIDYLKNVVIVEERAFTFDHVLGPTVSQQEVFDLLIRPLISKVKQGFNCTAFAYGQTGTGKTYTMGLSSSHFEGEQVGVIPRCLSELLVKDSKDENVDPVSSSEGIQRELYASFIEVYNEKAYDLLGESSEPIVARGYKYTGGIRKPLANLEDCYNMLIQGTKNRHVRPTKLNSQSSRSHAIFTIHLRTMRGAECINSCLNLVDLAGSEGVRRTGHQGVAMSEGVHINQGLLCIGKVLQAMAQGNKIIPYRDSVLSSVLQDSLNSNSFLTLLACISPYRQDSSETLSTLRFAQNVKQLKHTPQVNAIFAEMKRNKTKTPFKLNSSATKAVPTPFPSKRPYASVAEAYKSGGKNGNSIKQRNTICTPGKIKHIDMNKFNQSEIGLTPKEKQKAQEQARLRAVIQTKPQPRPALELSNNRESLFEGTISSRGSLMSLNISTSTTLDMVSSKPVSYSPVVRKCMLEFERVLDNKISKMMETIITGNRENGERANTVHSTPYIPAESQPPTTMRQEMKSIMQEFLANNTMQDMKLSKKNCSSTTVTPINQNAECQLFKTSSPIFKMPQPLKSINVQANTSIDTSSSCVAMASLAEDSVNIIDDSASFAQNSITENTIMNKPLRRSRRISELSSQNDSLSSKLALNGSLQPLRRSTRKCIKKLYDERRRSIRLAAHLEVHEPENLAHRLKAVGTKSDGKRKTTTDSDRYKNLIPASQNPNNIAKHRKAVLDLLNTGSMKELQLLPCIGQKTAYQLVSHRTLHGKFRNFAQLEKLPIWRGNAWERFAQANVLTE